MSLEKDNRKLFTRLAIVALGMFGFGYALVPFYYQICAAWGVGNIDAPDARPVSTQIDTSRTVTIELASNTHNIAGRLKPLVSHVTVHPGEPTTVEYEVVNARNV